MCLGSGWGKGTAVQVTSCKWRSFLGISTAISKQAHETRVKPHGYALPMGFGPSFFWPFLRCLGQGHITVWQFPMVGPWLGVQPTPLPSMGSWGQIGGAPWAAGRQSEQRLLFLCSFLSPSCHAHSLPHPNISLSSPMKRFPVEWRSLEGSWTHYRFAWLFSHEG